MRCSGDRAARLAALASKRTGKKCGGTDGVFRDKKTSLHYLVRGHGEPLLLIHGLGGSGADWAFQVAALEKRFRVIVPDLPGSGHSPPPRGAYTIQGFATTLWSLLDHLGVERTNTIGFSLGGAGFALARWALGDRLHQLTSRVLLIAAEHDFTPLAEKRALAAALKADLVVVRGSRHGTPFDSVEVTNASLLALLTDQPLPPRARWVRDTPASAQALSLAGSIAEEHATARLLKSIKAVDRLAPV